MKNDAKTIRCAIYTRKSTEHGLEQEFNSLDAQREACEAYIKSQSFQGWRALPQQYDDPAYSGGNLDRPALKSLLADIEAGKIDVIVVYKIDRLTRSLADFAKLVEVFDAKSVSFVAVTQQFNTTTSMGRLTLNVLLSFAQFERELSAERVRDKVAASRRKGKWTGGTVPLGYDAKDKKLIINAVAADTVRRIFRLYLRLGSFGKLVAELDREKIVTKRRTTKVPKYQGGIPFTYGPLAYLLKNRIYVGEVHYGGKWFKGEHQAILDRELFDQVQEHLKSNTVKRKVAFSQSGALLQGKLFDDKNNRMGPSFSSKNGVRYRFYVSRALRGRKQKAGSVTRISAPEIETLVEQKVRSQLSDQNLPISGVISLIDRVVVRKNALDVSFTGACSIDPIKIPWSKLAADTAHIIPSPSARTPDQKVIQALARVHAWQRDLASGRFASIEDLAAAADLHPKVIRGGLRMAFLAPSILTEVLNGEIDATLRDLRKVQTMSWQRQRSELRLGEKSVDFR